MLWFFVVVVITGGGQFSMGDFVNAMPTETTKVELAMPDEATCEAVRQMNPKGECWAKTAQGSAKGR